MKWSCVYDPLHSPTSSGSESSFNRNDGWDFRGGRRGPWGPQLDGGVNGAVYEMDSDEEADCSPGDNNEGGNSPGDVDADDEGGDE